MPPRIQAAAEVSSCPAGWESASCLLYTSHTLLVGDTTNETDVARLMNGHAADLVFTDPPYNVDYEGYTEDRLTIPVSYTHLDVYKRQV